LIMFIDPRLKVARDTRVANCFVDLTYESVNVKKTRHILTSPP